MKIAVEGCCHGELDNIYATIAAAEQQHGFKVDVLLCCGDFQAVRNMADLSTMACPPKYRAMHDFYRYYTGEKTAPLLTIFIAGNHEAGNHIWELPYGGWVAPNMYYLGFAGAVRLGGLRIAGLSGIFDDRDYRLGHFESPPFTESSMRSLYHTREFDIFQLSQLQQPTDIFLSHDWPRNIAHFGDLSTLLRIKPFFREEIENGSLGNPGTEALLHHIRPAFWFAAHMHVKYPAVVHHDPQTAAAPNLPPATRFLALDKCLPRRDFLQIIDLPAVEGEPLNLQYDLEWLTVLRLTAAIRSHRREVVAIPMPGGPQRSDYRPTAEELEETRARFPDLTIPQNFAATVQAYPSNDAVGPHRNPQTVQLCDALGIPNPCDLLVNAGGPAPGLQGAAQPLLAAAPAAQPFPSRGRAPLLLPPPMQQAQSATPQVINPDAVDLDNLDDEPEQAKPARLPPAQNPDAIDLDDF